MKGHVDRSMGIVTRIAEALARIKPTDPLRLANREPRENAPIPQVIQAFKSSQVYLQQNKKKAEAKGKKCHAKTMWSLEKPI
jgi:hypothetical protein